MARRLASILCLVLTLGTLGALLLAPTPVYAHADLQQAEPAAGSAVPTPPDAVRLRFSEPLDGSATRVEVLDASGARVDLDDLTIGPPNDRLVTVSLGGLVEGVYSVRWWSLSQTDGHRWQGVYRFGVGRTPPPADGAPAALPSPFEVVIQWGALLATAFVLGSLAFRLWALEPVLAASGAAPKTMDRLGRALTVALGLLALASLGELAASFGLFSSAPPDAGGGFGGIGKVGALALLRLFLVPMIAYLAAPSGSTAMAVAFGALLVLTRGQVSHAAGGGLGSVLVDTAHQIAAGVWVGGACTFAVVMPVLRRERSVAARPVGVRFGQLALAAAGLAIVSGTLSGWLLGVDPTRLLDSRYGEALAVKLGLVALLLGAAFVVWRRTRRQEKQPPPPAPLPEGEGSSLILPPSPSPRGGGRGVGRLPIALATELTLGAAVLLAASALALLPPAGETSALPLDLVQPAGAQQQLRVHLILDRVRVGDVRAEVRVADATGRAVGQTAVQIEASELAPLNAALDPAPGVTSTYAEEQPDGRQTATLTPFTRPGWWHLLVTTTVQLEGTIQVPFDVLVPDPNRAGLDPPTPDPAAAQLYAATLARIERLGAVRQRDALADGAGGLVLSTARYVAPDRFQLTTAEGDESIAVGAVQAFRKGDEPWRTARRSAPFKYPTYASNYDGATAQRLGHDTTLDGRPAQVLTFYVPRDRAWYCWWIDAADGLLRREVMVAPAHYMTTLYEEQDVPAQIALP